MMHLTIPCQFFLSCVSSDNLFNVCASFERSSLILMLAKSCPTAYIQVFFALPCDNLTFLRYSLGVFLACVSGCKGMRGASYVSLLATRYTIFRYNSSLVPKGLFIPSSPSIFTSINKFLHTVTNESSKK